MSIIPTAIYAENAKQTIQIGSQRWELPLVVSDGECSYFYDVVGFRKPLKGEWFLSGAIVQMYESLNDLNTEYLVVEKRGRAIKKWVYAKS